MTEDTTKPENSEPVAGPVQRTVRPLLDQLRDCAQGLSLGADGMGWSPDTQTRAVAELCDAAAEWVRAVDDGTAADATVAEADVLAAARVLVASGW